jgi:hypothetical protein
VRAPNGSIVLLHPIRRRRRPDSTCGARPRTPPAHPLARALDVARCRAGRARALAAGSGLKRPGRFALARPLRWHSGSLDRRRGEAPRARGGHACRPPARRGRGRPAGFISLSLPNHTQREGVRAAHQRPRRKRGASCAPFLPVCGARSVSVCAQCVAKLGHRTEKDLVRFGVWSLAFGSVADPSCRCVTPRLVGLGYG